MSIINQLFFEKLIDGYVKTPLSLKEQTLTKLAIQLCQYSDLNKHILSTPSPASRTVWDDLIVKQSFVMCKMLLLPPPLISLLISRIRLIATRLLAWIKEHELRLQMSPIVVNQFLLSSDWTIEGRVNERKVAERLVQNEGIPVSDRYQLACLSCLEPYILSLWNLISPEYRRRFCNRDGEQMKLVRLWSFHLIKKSDLLIEPNSFWQQMFVDSVKTGQRTSVIYCWGILNESEKQEIIRIAASHALLSYEILRSKCEVYHLEDPTNKIVEYWEEKLWFKDVWCAMPEHYSDILHFLLLQMCKDQMVVFFNQLYFRNERLFECLLQSPNEVYFVSLITKMWGILPEKKYDALLITVVDRFINTECCNNKALQGYNYGHLLIELLDAAPELYKRYIFSTAEDWNRTFFYGIRFILFKMFQKESFDCRYIEVIQHILKQATLEEKRTLLLSRSGSKLCEFFIENNSYLEILDSLLAEVFSEEELETFKKNFFVSSGENPCFRILMKGDEKYVDSVLHWGNLSETEISEFKPRIINTMVSCNEITKLLKNLKMDCVERIMKYCLPTEASRRQFKETFLKLYAKYVCIKFVKSSQKEDLTQFLAWAFPSDDPLFRSIFAQDICQYVLLDLMSIGRWQDVDNFSKWCGVPPEEIDPLKVDVICNNKSVLLNLLRCEDAETISFYLKWSLLDVESATYCKNELDKYLSEATVPKFEYFGKTRVKELWDRLMEDRFSHLTQEQANESQNFKREGFGEYNGLSKKLKK